MSVIGAAKVLANRLKLHLHKINLPAIVSKYIGETEKVLQRLFDEYEAVSAMLFFDEADALFGKRTVMTDTQMFRLIIFWRELRLTKISHIKD